MFKPRLLTARLPSSILSIIYWILLVFFLCVWPSTGIQEIFMKDTTIKESWHSTTPQVSEASQVAEHSPDFCFFPCGILFVCLFILYCFWGNIVVNILHEQLQLLWVPWFKGSSMSRRHYFSAILIVDSWWSLFEESILIRANLPWHIQIEIWLCSTQYWERNSIKFWLCE